MSEIRMEVLQRFIERLDHLMKIGVIGPDADILIDVNEAAALSGLAPKTLRKWGQEGKIARYKLDEDKRKRGKTPLRFGLRDFSAWLASRRQPSNKERLAAKGGTV